MNHLKTIKINLFILTGFLLAFASVFSFYDFLTRNSRTVEESRAGNSNFARIEDALTGESMLKEYSISYYPDFASNFYGLKEDIFPINGISNIRTYYCSEQGYLSSYISDIHGFNNSSDTFNKGSLDIALIGDSYVHGACTNQSSIQQNLSNSFPDLKIASFAQGGAGPLLELAYLKEFARHYKPKLVYWVWVANDLRNLQDELQSPLRFYMQSDFEQGLFVAKNKAIADTIVSKYLLNIANKKRDSMADTAIANITVKDKIKTYFPKSFDFFRRVYSKIPRLVAQSQFSNPTLTRNQVLTRSLTKREDEYLLKPASLVLSEAKNVVELNGGKLILIYLGFGGWSSKQSIDKDKFLDTHQLQESFLKQYAKEHQVRFFNLSSDIDNSFSSKDHIIGHFSDQGYKKVSEIFANYIKSETIHDHN